MKKCTICNQEKVESEFQTYFHSVQNIFRTRNQCTPCFNEKKFIYRYKKLRTECLQCGEHKLKSEFPTYKSISKNDKRRQICLKCTSSNSKNKRKKILIENFEEMVYSQPNRYHSIEQKETTFELMIALGFTFNESNGIWFKEGFKTPDGIFIPIEEKERRKMEKIDKEIEGLEIEEKVIYLFNNNFTQMEISKKIGIDYCKVQNIVRRPNGKKKNY